MADFLKAWDTKKHLVRFRRAFDLHALFSGLLGCFEHYRQTSCMAALTSNGQLFEILLSLIFGLVFNASCTKEIPWINTEVV